MPSRTTVLSVLVYWQSRLTNPVHAVDVFHLPDGEVEERKVVSHLYRRLRPRTAHTRTQPTFAQIIIILHHSHKHVCRCQCWCCSYSTASRTAPYAYTSKYFVLISDGVHLGCTHQRRADGRLLRVGIILRHILEPWDSTL